MKNKRIIAEFWDENYTVQAMEKNRILDKVIEITFCGLCGNTGIIDTTQSAITPNGTSVGKKFYCLCPNGRALKANKN